MLQYWCSRKDSQLRNGGEMANLKVNLTKRVSVKSKNGKEYLRFCPVVEGYKGKVRPDVVSVDGKHETHKEGAYYIDWTDGEKRYRLAVGKNLQDAELQRRQKEAELNAIANGLEVPNAPRLTNGSNKRSLRTLVDSYLDGIKLSRKPKTHAACSKALEYFLESCPRLYIEDVTRIDLLKFTAFLRDEKNQSPRSVYNKFERLMSFLKANDIAAKDLKIKTEDRPVKIKENVEIYDKEDLDKFFAACNEEERMWFEFFLMTGMREQEVMHAYWSDVNLHNHSVQVTHKPDRNWTPKAYKEREIPIPDTLVHSLRAWKAKADKTCNLLFPTAGCKPKLDFLDCCKRVAARAKLNKDDFWLHKFRATFATWHLWAGVDLRTVQDWMGHTDLESTMRYLKPQPHSQQVRVKVNTTFSTIGVSQ
jgi:integrase/recombinase XerD